MDRHSEDQFSRNFNQGHGGIYAMSRDDKHPQGRGGCGKLVALLLRRGSASPAFQNHKLHDLLHPNGPPKFPGF